MVNEVASHRANVGPCFPHSWAAKSPTASGQNGYTFSVVLRVSVVFPANLCVWSGTDCGCREHHGDTEDHGEDRTEVGEDHCDQLDRTTTYSLASIPLCLPFSRQESRTRDSYSPVELDKLAADSRRKRAASPDKTIDPPLQWYFNPPRIGIACLTQQTRMLYVHWTVVGSLVGGGDLGNVDSISVCDPTSLAFLAWGV